MLKGPEYFKYKRNIDIKNSMNRYLFTIIMICVDQANYAIYFSIFKTIITRGMILLYI